MDSAYFVYKNASLHTPRTPHETHRSTLRVCGHRAKHVICIWRLRFLIEENEMPQDTQTTATEPVSTPPAPAPAPKPGVGGTKPGGGATTNKPGSSSGTT
jgi:hypothetical protein